MGSRGRREKEKGKGCDWFFFFLCGVLGFVDVVEYVYFVFDNLVYYVVGWVENFVGVEFFGGGFEDFVNVYGVGEV